MLKYDHSIRPSQIRLLRLILSLAKIGSQPYLVFCQFAKYQLHAVVWDWYDGFYPAHYHLLASNLLQIGVKSHKGTKLPIGFLSIDWAARILSSVMRVSRLPIRPFLRAVQPGPCVFNDDFALKLIKSSIHVEEEPAFRCWCVDILSDDFQANLPFL